MNKRVRIYEVGPRDGLQNEAVAIPTATKARFIDLLGEAGLLEIEATSFVAPRAIPQLADADELLGQIQPRPGVRYPVSSRTCAGWRGPKPPVPRPWRSSRRQRMRSARRTSG